MIEETDLTLAAGRTLRCYDTGGPGDGLTVFWHHGSPNTGAPPEPLFPAAAERGIRWVSYDRPGYVGSTSRPGRDAELWIPAADGHVSVLGSCGVAALDWLVTHA